MAKKKDISELVPDLKRGLMNSTFFAAQNISKGVREAGPYWTGQFYENWIVEAGQDGIPATLRDQSTINSNGVLEYQGKEYREPGDKPAATPAYVQPPTDLRGYMIGNVMEYRDEAMDLKPGVRTDNFTRLTAREDWFVGYTKGSEMQADLRSAVQKGLRKEGF